VFIRPVGLQSSLRVVRQHVRVEGLERYEEGVGPEDGDEVEKFPRSTSSSPVGSRCCRREWWHTSPGIEAQEDIRRGGDEWDDPPAPTLTAAIDQFNVCIKIGNAKNRVETEIPDAIMAFLRNGKAYFKFVVDDPGRTW